MYVCMYVYVMWYRQDVYCILACRPRAGGGGGGGGLDFSYLLEVRRSANCLYCHDNNIYNNNNIYY